jgi:hypothetical protein
MINLKAPKSDEQSGCANNDLPNVVVSIPASYSRRLGFKFRPRDRQPSLSLLVVFLSLPRWMPGVS